MAKKQNPYLGAYRFENNGHLMSIRMSVLNSLRYRIYETGESGQLYRQEKKIYLSGEGFSGKNPVKKAFNFEGNSAAGISMVTWIEVGEDDRKALRCNTIEEVHFERDGVTFYGQLHLPDGKGPHPAMVLVHGSGRSAGTDMFYNADFFAGNGIATLVFDKRGTGQSGGKFTFDFHVLAEDLLAGVKYLRNRSEIDPDRIGLSGYSQGGWVAPLAASKDPGIRCVIVNYGMIESAAVEARLETLLRMEKKGVKGEDLEDIGEFVDAVVYITATDFKKGWEKFIELKQKYRNASWRGKLRGETANLFWRYPIWLIKVIGRFYQLKGLDWEYNSKEVLKQLNIPMLWLLAEKDEGAPNKETIPALERLIAQGKPFEMVVYPQTDHGILVFEEEEGDYRTITGYPDNYFTKEVEWAMEQLQ